MEHTIKTFEDACKKLGLNPDALPDLSMLEEKYRKALIANYKLTIIAEALNEGWQPDWNNTSQPKYYPWPEVDASTDKPSGFSFSDSDYSFSLTDSSVGSRLCFKSSELALYALEQFKELYLHELLMNQ